MWIAEWIVNPAALTRRLCCFVLHHVAVESIFTRSDARISWNITPYWLIRKWCSGPGQPRADMGIDQVRPAMVRDQPVQRGEIAADLPFLVGYAGERGGQRGNVHGLPFINTSSAANRSVDLARPLQRVAQLRRREVGRAADVEDDLLAPRDQVDRRRQLPHRIGRDHHRAVEVGVDHVVMRRPACRRCSPAGRT